MDGQQTDSPLAQLEAAYSVRCDLPEGVVATWDESTLKIETDEFGDGSEFTFDSIDLSAGRARIVGNAGTSDVAVWLTPTGLMFAEGTASGNMVFTTIFATYDSPSSRRYLAVRSRHNDVLGPMPSQYYGKCTILQ